MAWVERRWKHVVFTAALSATVIATTFVGPAVAGPKVPGIDVSKYQGRIDWDAVATTPVRFVIMRATLGNVYRDGRFARNAAEARRVGLTVGAYHFAKPSLARWDPRAEADHFLNVVGLQAGDVVPVLDIEETGGLSSRQLRTWATAWLRRVEERTGVRAMIYSGNYFWHGFMRNTPWFAHRDHPLWVAHWYVGAPDVPGGRWAGRGYTVWQWSAAGRISGIKGPVDRDWMRGNLAQGTVASIDVQPAEGGVITADRIACGGRLGFCSRLANPGDEITLQAIPADGVQLVRWTGACAAAGVARTCVVAALGRRSISAVFGPRIEVVVPSAEPAPVAPVAGGTPTPPEPTSEPTDHQNPRRNLRRNPRQNPLQNPRRNPRRTPHARPYARAEVVAGRRWRRDALLLEPRA